MAVSTANLTLFDFIILVIISQKAQNVNKFMPNLFLFFMYQKKGAKQKVTQKSHPLY